MGWAALTSGGKDSVLSCQRAIDSGKDVDFLVTVRPENRDSFMFHSANLDAVPVIARHAGMKYVEIRTHGRKEEELADLEKGLSLLPVEGIVVGAIASEYQNDRVAAIAKNLGIEVFAPLWKQDPEAIVTEVAERLDAIIVVTAAEGLDESFLGARFDSALIGRLKAAVKKYRIHIAGEGGEYESLTLNAPFFGEPVTYESSEIRRSPGRSELVLGGFA
ncbi:MAG TPA: diphthine--ammonia ligase [Methanoregulaceae archaeon]|nr:diphthine--ammonia ligase [Methanoregulaceae archaeon]HRY76361.1 diphthine--ammonia ligase [Methanoregulaceae archaeon]